MMHADLTPALFKAHPALFDNVKARYGEPHRYYHTWAHIEELLAHFQAVQSFIDDQDSVLLTLYYHDAIYNIPSASNEEDSAALFAANADGHLTHEAITLGRDFILATKTHEINPHLSNTQKSDCAFFLDMDMAILGAEEDAYREYADKIRREYAVIPDDLYHIGRKKILTEFLQRTRLFMTDHYHEKFDAPARRNIAGELRALTEGGV